MRAFLALALLLVLTLFCVTADAHAVGLSTGEYSAHGSTLVGKLAFARNEVASLVPQVDRNGDGHVTAGELADGKDLITSKILSKIKVTAGGSACPPALDDAGLTEQDGVLLTARWSCQSDDKDFNVDMQLLDDLGRGHRHIARAIIGEGTRDVMLFGDTRTFTVPPESADARAKAEQAKPAEQPNSFFSFFKLGIEHILTGYDHLVFLFGLLIMRSRVKSLLAIVTAFTIAHSISLALAALDVWAPSPRIVEPAIALSIAYVGVENVILSRRNKSAEKRWRITFPFGLIHGFGFAGALREVGLPRSSIPTALVGFNLGVEFGQLAVLAVLLPLIALIRRKTWFDQWAVPGASILVILAGLVWFVARVVSPS